MRQGQSSCGFTSFGCQRRHDTLPALLISCHLRPTGNLSWGEQSLISVKVAVS